MYVYLTLRALRTYSVVDTHMDTYRNSKHDYQESLARRLVPIVSK